MKNYKTQLLLIFILISTNYFSQKKEIHIGGNSLISFQTTFNKLKIKIKYKNKIKEYEYGTFESDTSLLNDDNFIVRNNDTSSLENHVFTNDSLILTSIADWNDRTYIFSFKIINDDLVPVNLEEGKIKELFITRASFIYYDSFCNVVININKELEEYIYRNNSKTYCDVEVYNLAIINEDLMINKIKLDLFDWIFLNDMLDSDSYKIFNSGYKKIYNYLNLCK
jgi:hypothetical protein